MCELNISEIVKSLETKQSNPKDFFRQLQNILRDDKFDLVLENYTKGKDVDFVETAYDAITNGDDVFLVTHVLEKVVKYSIYKKDSLYSLLEKINQLMKNDMASGMQYNVISQVAKKDPGFAESFLSFLMNKNEDWSLGYRSAIYTVLFERNQNKIFSEVAHLSSEEAENPQIIAIQFFGKIKYEKLSKDKLHEVFTILEKLRQNKNSALDVQIIHALKSLVYQSSEFEKIIYEYMNYNDDNVRYQLSHLLFLVCSDYSDKQWFKDLLFSFKNISFKYGGTIQNISMVLNQLLSDKKHKNMIIDFVFEWLLNSDLSDNSSELKFFSDFISHKEVADTLLTLGLNHDDYRINKSMSSFISSEIEFDVAILKNFDVDDYIYIIRKVLGYFYSFEDTGRLLFSILKTEDLDENIINTIKDVLINFVGKVYPVDTKDFAEKILENKKYNEIQTKVAKDILATLEKREKLYESLERPLEVKPLTKEARLVANAEYQLIQKAYKEGEKISVLSSLASKFYIKYGKGSFSYFNGAYQDPMHMKSISHSMSIPNSERTNPVDAAMERYMFKIARRGEL